MSADKYRQLNEVVRQKLEAKYPRENLTQAEQVYEANFTDVTLQVKRFAERFGGFPKDVRLSTEAYLEHGEPIAYMLIEVAVKEDDERYYKRLWSKYQQQQQDHAERLQLYLKLKAEFEPSYILCSNDHKEKE